MYRPSALWRQRVPNVLRLLPAAALLLAACTSQGSGIGFVAAGAPAALPARGSLVPVSGRDFRAIVAGQRGRPVVVNIWASWCGPCRVEAPLLERAAAHYRLQVTFLGVNAQDSPDSAARFLARYKITYPNVADVNDEITQMLGLRGFPTTYIFDARGHVRFSVVGGISEQTLAARLAQVLQ